jgi:hypothetical protein
MQMFFDVSWKGERITNLLPICLSSTNLCFQCLLEWMAAQEVTSNRPQGAISCPQCQTQYTIVSYQPPLLPWFDRIHTYVLLVSTGSVLTGAVFTVAGTFIAMGCAYGVTAFDAFMGDNMLPLLFGSDISRWSPVTWFNMAFVPLSLLTTGYRHNFFSNYIGMMLALPLTEMLSHEDKNVAFPPSPVVTISLLPILVSIRNLVYPLLENWVKRKATIPIKNRSSYKMGVRNVGTRPEVIVNVQGMAGAAVQFPGNRVLREQEPAGQAGAPAPNNLMARPVGNNIDRILRGTQIGSTLVRPLMLPWIARSMGAILLKISRYVTPLQSLLGERTTKLPLLRQRGTQLMGLGTTWKWSHLDPVW